MGGFSDGATYGISLGLVNGDLFRRVLAFSPGFFVGTEARGKPILLCIARHRRHRPADRPLQQGDRPALQKNGYDVTFRQFDGGHEIPPAIARAGFRWVTAV